MDSMNIASSDAEESTLGRSLTTGVTEGSHEQEHRIWYRSGKIGAARIVSIISG